MLQIYPAVIHEEDGYWIEFPDLPGCQTCGDTLNETLEAAQEALGLYLVSLDESHQTIPEPSKIEGIDVSDGQTTYVTTDMNKYRRDTRAVKKMISIPAWMAKEAEINNISLSKILQGALEQQLNIAR